MGASIAMTSSYGLGCRVRMNFPPVRPFESKDRSDIIVLWQSALCREFPDFLTRFPPTMYEAKLDEMLAAGHRIWVAPGANRVYGFATAHNRLIRNLFVAPEDQGRGIGTRLLETM